MAPPRDLIGKMARSEEDICKSFAHKRMEYPDMSVRKIAIKLQLVTVLDVLKQFSEHQTIDRIDLNLEEKTVLNILRQRNELFSYSEKIIIIVA